MGTVKQSIRAPSAWSHGTRHFYRLQVGRAPRGSRCPVHLAEPSLHCSHPQKVRGQLARSPVAHHPDTVLLFSRFVTDYLQFLFVCFTDNKLHVVRPRVLQGLKAVH